MSRNGEHHVYSHCYRLASRSLGDGASETLSYDSAGRVTGMSGGGRELTLTYDSFDKVKSVTTLGETRSTTFDGEGRRVGIVDSDGSRNVMESDVVTPYDVPLAIRNGASETTYVYAGEHASSRTHILADGTSATRYYSRDAMGSVMGMVDESGNVVASFAYDAFGRTLLASGAEANTSSTAGDFRFHGMWQDPSGLYYVRARSYDPETGRFLTKDPVEPDVMQPETWHPYAPVRWDCPRRFHRFSGAGLKGLFDDCANNIRPLRYSDPSGGTSWGDFQVDKTTPEGTRFLVGASSTGAGGER